MATPQSHAITIHGIGLPVPALDVLVVLATAAANDDVSAETSGKVRTGEIVPAPSAANGAGSLEETASVTNGAATSAQNAAREIP